MNREADVDGAVGTDVAVELLAYPYPFKSAMAICSDLDKTRDAGVYAEIARFLNTSQTTAMGPGVDLEVGNSIYFLMPDDQYSYFGTDEAGREMARALIRSGHIDVLHSYGDFARSRDDAKRCIDELVRHDLRLKVWVDHSKAVTNFGPDIMVGSGDVAEAEAYHADLTTDYGVRFVWRGRTTGVTGQDVPIGARSLMNVFDWRHPVGSGRTMVKEAVKIRLGRKGHPRWEMYADNRVLRSSRLRDGQPVWEFLRSNPYWRGSGKGDTGDGVGYVLTQRMLDHLLRSGGVCVLYSHLGKVRDPRCPFGVEAVAGFRRLAAMREAGSIFVTTTHRLLRYLSVRDCLTYSARRGGDRVTVTVEGVDDEVSGRRWVSADEAMGLTFAVDRCDDVVVRMAEGEAFGCDVVHDGRRTIATVRWRGLTFPDV